MSEVPVLDEMMTIVVIIEDCMVDGDTQHIIHRIPYAKNTSGWGELVKRAIQDARNIVKNGLEYTPKGTCTSVMIPPRCIAEVRIEAANVQAEFII